MSGKDNFFNKKFHQRKVGPAERVVKKDDSGDKTNVKVFDKKSYRIKKYSNKYKLDKWEQNRRKDVLKNYYKEVQKDPTAGNYKPFKFDDDDNDDKPVEEFKPPNYVMHPDLLEKFRVKPKTANPFTKAKLEMQRLKDERRTAREAAVVAREEKARANEAYKQKKAERFKKLSRKTKSGQPLMKDRMQMLLEAIQRKEA